MVGYKSNQIILSLKTLSINNIHSNFQDYHLKIPTYIFYWYALYTAHGYTNIYRL